MPNSLVPERVPVTLAEIPDDSVGATRETLRHMVKYARQYKTDSGIITLSRQLLANVGGSANGKNYSEFIRALQHFVRDSIRYVPDIHGVEMLQTPLRTLDIQTGDCDDKATLLATLLVSVGIPARFLAVGYNGGIYSHVLVEAKIGPNWVPLETIIDGKEPGWLPQSDTRRITRWMHANV